MSREVGVGEVAWVDVESIGVSRQIGGGEVTWVDVESIVL